MKDNQSKHNQTGLRVHQEKIYCGKLKRGSVTPATSFPFIRTQTSNDFLCLDNLLQMNKESNTFSKLFISHLIHACS